jgi:Tfp pilus assembly protein PilF
MMSNPATDSKPAPNSLTWLIGAGLVLAIFAAYWSVAGYAFIGFDDNDYVWQNPQVLKGLSWPGFCWAFTHFYVGNWHPLTWLSHMLDVQLYGVKAGGHHVTSVLFHAANTVLVFLWLKRLTGFVGRSAMVAVLFGLHPLHVESVAWVAERKDVLSTFFFLLTLMAYTRYVEQFKIQNSKFKISYGLALVFFALGLMSKPMLVTLPFVLLLLDFWPLNRIRHSEFEIRNLTMLLVEKVPFFLLSAGSCFITLLAQHSGHAVMPVKFLPVEARVQNTLDSYALYVEKMFWPDALAAYYPLAYPIDAGEVVVAVFLLVLVSAGVFFLWRQRPYLAMGWCWYLGTLVPVIGLVQVGSQALADRYTYVPLIGLFIALVWLVAEIKPEWPHRRLTLTFLSAGVLVACWQLTATQVRCWENSETLSRHALAVTTNNALMQGLLGSALFEQGKAEPAAEHFAEAVRIWPDSVTAQCDLALALAAQGRLDEAVDGLQAALKYKPQAPEIHDLLGNLFSKQGKYAEAMEEYKTVLQVQPDNVVDLNNLAWLLATANDASLRDGPEAVRLAEKACQLSNYQAPLCVGTLAAAYAEVGRFDDAVATAQKAIELATLRKNDTLAKKNRELLELYQHQKPCHESGSH